MRGQGRSRYHPSWTTDTLVFVGSSPCATGLTVDILFNIDYCYIYVDGGDIFILKVLLCFITKD